MGDSVFANMFKALALVALLCAVTFSAPVDSIVPEEEFVQPAAQGTKTPADIFLQQSWDDAVRTVRNMRHTRLVQAKEDPDQADKDQTDEISDDMVDQDNQDENQEEETTSNPLEQGNQDCKDLADATEESVTNSVKSQQDLIDAMENGDSCPHAGKTVLTEAEQHVVDTQEQYDLASETHKNATKVQITYRTFDWDELHPDNCDAHFFDTGPWADQKKIVDDLATKKTEKAGAKDTAEEELQAAHKTAETLVAECKCQVIEDMQAAVDQANAEAQSANQAAWTKAAHIRCVVAGTPQDECEVTDAPTVKMATLAEGTECVNGSLLESDLIDKDGWVTLSEKLGVNDWNDIVWHKCWDSSVQSAVSGYSNAYHNACDGNAAGHEGKAITIIKSDQGLTYGAFSMVCPAGVQNYVKDDDAQLFSVSHGYTTFTTQHPQYAMYCNTGYGPTFGGGHDIYTPGAWATNTGYTNPHSYKTSDANPGVHYSNTYLSGKYTSKAVRIEVFKSVPK